MIGEVVVSVSVRAALAGRTRATTTRSPKAHFKTAKYHPSYPGRFATLEHSLDWGREFFPWYNHEHKHSGIAYLTPADVHFGRAEERLAQRHAVLLAAYAEHPERFPHGGPKRQVLPGATYINPPSSPAHTACSSRVAVDDALSTHLMLAPEETQ